MADEKQQGGVLNAKERMHTIRALLDQSKAEMQRALPRMMQQPEVVERMCRVAITAVRRNPSLMGCTPVSVIGSVIQAAQLGLDVDGELQHAHLVPYKDQCKLMIGYKGFIFLATRTGLVRSIVANAVFEGDKFDFAYGLSPVLVHKPALRQVLPKKVEQIEAEMVAVYCVANLNEGAPIFQVLSRGEVNAHRARSKAANKGDGPWITDYVAMARKTAVRDTAKWLPMSSDPGALLVHRAVTIDELNEIGKGPDPATLLPSSVVESDEQKEQLDKLAEELGHD